MWPNFQTFNFINHLTNKSILLKNKRKYQTNRFFFLKFLIIESNYVFEIQKYQFFWASWLISIFCTFTGVARSSQVSMVISFGIVLTSFVLGVVGMKLKKKNPLLLAGILLFVSGNSPNMIYFYFVLALQTFMSLDL